MNLNQLANDVPEKNENLSSIPKDLGVEPDRGQWTSDLQSPAATLKQRKGKKSVKVEQDYQGADLISDALSQLSLQEREKAVHEMHGVNEPLNESSDYIDSKVMELHHTLFQMSREHKDSMAFKLAEQQNADFVYHRVACERFLRAAEFNVLQAANSMLRYYDWKLELWGLSMLCKEIDLDDLDDSDIDVLKKGYMQFLPQRDRAGRAVCVIIMNNQEYRSPKCMGRVLWYMYDQRLHHDSENMAVTVLLHLAEPNLQTMNPELLQVFQRAADIPIRKAAFHHCIDDSTSWAFRLFLKHLIINADTENKAKTKVHAGSFTEWNYALMTYGIPQHLIPVTEDGKIKVKNHLEFLQGRKMREQLYKIGKFDAYSIPLNSDILLGRGKPIQQTAGNLRLAAIVDGYVLNYHKLTNKQAKTALAAKVVQLIKGASGRFLTKESGLWVEVSDDAAREKVSGLFRTLYRTRYPHIKAAANKEAAQRRESSQGGSQKTLRPDMGLSDSSDDEMQSTKRSRYDRNSAE